MDQNKIQYYDLKFEALNKRLFPIVGRTEEQQRLSRITNRTIQNNAFIVGPKGIGKSALMHGWACAQKTANIHLIRLEAQSFQQLTANPSPLSKFTEALERIPESVIFIDDFGGLIFGKTALLTQISRIFNPLAHSSKTRLVFSLTPAELNWLAEHDPSFAAQFEKLTLGTPPADDILGILKKQTFRLFAQSPFKIQIGVLELIIELSSKFGSLGQLPLSAMTILDEAVALSKLRKKALLTEADIYRIVSDKTGVPLTQLQTNELEQLKKLESTLNTHVIGQTEALHTITSTIQRAKLGLKNPNRPLGSFLILGPSGVGKTETAKLLAEHVFGKQEQFLRLDMSEFGQEISVQRLIGAPPGYVGYEAGGGLTEPILNNPYTLVLLDEIEKAHPKIFDIFLQVLDDGRLTSGKSELVDFTQTIIMATSNIGVSEILEGFHKDEDVTSPEFIESRLIPSLSRHFRLEFLNRFDAILVFKPLTTPDLLSIAQLEIKKIEQRIKKYNIGFNLEEAVLRSKIEQLTDPRFGARPVKRFIETTCETLITKTLLQ